MEKLQLYFSELASLFGYKYDDSFFEYLKSISTPNNTICGKRIIKDEGCWECKNCQITTNSIYCNGCFVKEKHEGHEIYFYPSDTGVCDCGDATALKREGFCDKHKGDYDNIKDLMNYIKSSIDEKLLNNINEIFNKIFLLFIELIQNLYDNRYEIFDMLDNLEIFCDKHKGEYTNMKDLMDFIKSSIDEKLLDNINNIFNKIILLFIDRIKNLEYYKEEEDEEDGAEIYKMFDSLEIFVNKLYKNNLSLFYFFTLKFTENFPYKTNHKCFSYDENKNLVIFIKEDIEKEHTCICPFMQVMIYVLMKRNTKQNSSSFINFFIQTYKNKIVTSLCYLNCFSELFYNNNLKVFREMAFQLVNENLSILVFQDQNIQFLETCFEEIYSICNYCLQIKDYDSLKKIIFRFYLIIKYIPRKTTINKMNSNIKLINIIINICCLINNTNIFENKIKFKVFQKNGLEINLIFTEDYCLLAIINLTHIINFDNQEIINSIFNIIFGKIYEFKKYKESLPNKIFSPHLTIIKCYSVFLNRFCFNYSIKNECDLLDSFNHFINIYPKSKEIHEFIFKELINFFGFIISQIHSFFNYFGENMFSYYEYYFKNGYNYTKCDITLLKYLLTQPEIKSKFNLQNILTLSDIDSSNKFLLDLLNGNFDINNIKLFKNTEEKYLKYNNSVLEFLYLIIRDNLSMEKLAFRNAEFKLKMNDEIYEKLYQNEKDKIKSLVKNEIIHFILGKKNLVKRDDCMEYMEKNFDNNHIELVDDIIKNHCEKIVLTNGLIEFSLKKEVLNSCDIDYIISSKKRINAIEYMTNFQTNNFNLSNINMIGPLNIEKNLIMNVYQSFYNEKNIDDMIKLYNLIFTNKKKAKLLNQIFYSNLTKILSFAYKLCSTDLLDEDLKKN